mgnify:CR=1 FL=1
MNRIKLLLPIIFLLFVFSCRTKKEEPLEKPNVLFLIVDDLRTALGTYNYPDVISPNIDQLASEGVRFDRSYCNVPVCGASRASFLTGFRPHFPDRFNNYYTHVEEDAPEALTLPRHFRNNGYIAISNGKVFHHQYDKAEDWSESPWKPDTTSLIDFSNVSWMDSASLDKMNPETGAGPYFEGADAPDSLYFDAKLAKKTISDLKRLAKQDKPFFLSVGFHKPHLPFNAPKKYYDLYDTIQIAENRFRPEGLPDEVRNSREIFVYGYLDHYNSLEFHYEARHAYYACVSFIDTQVGRIMNELESQGLDKNTIVVLIGDHGWHLGEHNFWGKHNVLHNALNTPMIIKAPGVETGVSDKIVEFVDLYPTLCDLAGIELPGHLHGSSMKGILTGNDDDWENMAFCEWKGARTVITDQYSYSKWPYVKNRNVQLLFDHSVDPNENINVVNEEKYSEVVKSHSRMIDSLYAEFWPEE